MESAACGRRRRQGAHDGGDGAPLKTAEIYDPKKNEFKVAGSMKAARIFPAPALAL